MLRQKVPSHTCYWWALTLGHKQFSFYSIYSLWHSKSTFEKKKKILPQGYNQVLFKTLVGLQKLFKSGF